MTRQEAVNKLEGHYPDGERLLLINALEALGLIKIDAPRDIVLEQILGKHIGLSQRLEQAGYKIIKEQINAAEKG